MYKMYKMYIMYKTDVNVFTGGVIRNRYPNF